MTRTTEERILRLHRWRLVWVTGVVVAVDLATKALASATLAGRSIHVIGPLHLRLGHNPGVAFGLGDAAPTWMILAISSTVAVLLAAAAWRHHIDSAVAAGLILGGAVANLIDRLEAGTVVDMFDLRWWPTFNVADIGITLGVGLLLLSGGRGRATT